MERLLTANQKETKPALAKVLNSYTVAVSINAKNGICDIPKQANEYYTTIASPTVSVSLLKIVIYIL
jgi:hypothetical protein